MVTTVVSFLMEVLIKFKTDNKNVYFPTVSCLESIYDKFSVTESREVSVNGNVCDVLADNNSIDKSDKLKIHKYFMTKNNTK